jgi:hypothetical protein
MDRRTFLSGVGTLGAAAAGTVSLGSNEASTRAAGLAKAAGAPGPITARLRAMSGTAKARGLVLGSLGGDPTLLADRAAAGERLRWSTPRDSSSTLRGFLGTAPATEGRVSVMLGALRLGGAAPLFRSIDVTAHFAIDEGGFAPFYASSFRAAGGGRHAMASQPVIFDALVPDCVALQVDYLLDDRAIGPGVAVSGSMYLPVGADGAAASGVHVLAGPSHATGLPPGLSSYLFTGDLHAPIVDSRGDAPDFDHVALSIHAA